MRTKITITIDTAMLERIRVYCATQACGASTSGFLSQGARELLERLEAKPCP
jgi:hypothetical protein